MTNDELETLRETIHSYGFSPQVSLEIIEHINSLSPKRRAIILLALGGLNHHEIAKKLGIPRRTISDNISIILPKLLPHPY